MDNIKIEKMKKTDFKEASNVLRVVFNGEGEEWDEESSLKHVEENYSGEAEFIAKDENRVIGVIMGTISTEESKRYIFVDIFVVLKEYRGQGVGKRLWNTIIEYAKKHDCHGISLIANPEFDSYNWYKRMGLEESGWKELYIEF